MAIIITLLVIAVIVFLILTMINVRTISSGTKAEAVKTTNVQVEYLDHPLELQDQGKSNHERNQKVPNKIIDDQSYRKTLKSIKEATNKVENKNPTPDEKINDNDYRKALQFISDQKE